MTEPRRILFAYRDDVDTQGGAAAVMKRTAEALQGLGIDAEISYDAEPDPAGFDVVHAVNVWSPESALHQLRHLRAAGATVVWQPFYLGYSELAWAMHALPVVFDPARPAAEREQLVAAFTAGAIDVGGVTRWGRNEPLPGFRAAAAEMVELADLIVVCSMHEAQMLSQDVGLRGTSFTHTPHGVQAERFAGATAAAFRAHAGLGDQPFALCVGAIDIRKNQIVLAHALRDSGIPLVLLGPALEQDKLDLVRAAGGDNVIHLDRVDAELVASAYHAASVHVLPSWAEGAALANLEAAAAGCPIVVSDRSSEFEYFGDLARYCDPADPASIRGAVEGALDARSRDAELIAELKRRMADLTWENTARATVRAYAAAVRDAAARRQADGGSAGAPRPRRAPVSPRLRQFTAGLPWTRGPILDFVRELSESIPEGARVLDVGAGEAPYRELFDHADYVTSDWTHSVHAGARAVDFVGPAHDLPIDDESFDHILLTEVLEHTPNPVDVLRELHRILRPGGRLHMTTPFVWELHELPFDFYRYTPWALDRVMRDAGFAATDIEPRNDCFSTLAQMMVDIGSTMGAYPDGRDGERASAIGDLRATGERIARYASLDVRRAFPLGYRAHGYKAPLPERARGGGVEGARAFATLVYADEILFDPQLLRAYGERFTDADDATLVIYAPFSDRSELEQRLLQTAATAGMAGRGAADMLALPYTRRHPDEAELAASVDAVLSLNPPRGAFALVPHYHQATMDELRAAVVT